MKKKYDIVEVVDEYWDVDFYLNTENGEIYAFCMDSTIPGPFEGRGTLYTTGGNKLENIKSVKCVKELPDNAYYFNIDDGFYTCGAYTCEKHEAGVAFIPEEESFDQEAFENFLIDFTGWARDGYGICKRYNDDLEEIETFYDYRKEEVLSEHHFDVTKYIAYIINISEFVDIKNIINEFKENYLKALKEGEVDV